MRHQGRTQNGFVCVLTHVAHKVLVHFQRFSTCVTWKIFTNCALCQNVFKRVQYWRRTCLHYWGQRPPDIVSCVLLNTDNVIKSHQCNHCDFASSHTGHLRRHLKTHSAKSHTNATNACACADPSSLSQHAYWKRSNKCNQCDCASYKQAVRGDMWKHTVEKNQTNATSVIMHHLTEVHCGNIWKFTVEKSWTNAASVTLHPSRQAI